MFEMLFEEADISMILKPNKEEKIGGLYLGSQITIQNELILKMLKIKCIISLQDTLSCRKLSDSLNLKFHENNCMIIKANDSNEENLEQYFIPAIEFIETKRGLNQNILVHCNAGCSRSPAIILAYLISRYDQSVEEAFKFVKQKRSFISPKENFMQQLEEFWKKLQENLLDQSQHNISINSSESF